MPFICRIDIDIDTSLLFVTHFLYSSCGIFTDNDKSVYSMANSFLHSSENKIFLLNLQNILLPTKFFDSILYKYLKLIKN